MTKDPAKPPREKKTDLPPAKVLPILGLGHIDPIEDLREALFRFQNHVDGVWAVRAKSDMAKWPVIGKKDQAILKNALHDLWNTSDTLDHRIWDVAGNANHESRLRLALHRTQAILRRQRPEVFHDGESFPGFLYLADLDDVIAARDALDELDTAGSTGGRKTKQAPAAALPYDDSWLDPGGLAKLLSGPQAPSYNALLKRLDRWRDGAPEGADWRDSQPCGKVPKYIYRFGAVKHLLNPK